MHTYMTGGTWLNSIICKKNLDFLGDHKLSMSQQCLAAAKRVNAILGCIYRGVTPRSQAVIIPFSAALVSPHLQCRDPFASPVRRRVLGTGKSSEKSYESMIGLGMSTQKKGG